MRSARDMELSLVAAAGFGAAMNAGMGQASASIYAHELFAEYDVQTLIRVGTCGALTEDVRVRDVIVAMSASTDS